MEESIDSDVKNTYTFKDFVSETSMSISLEDLAEFFKIGTYNTAELFSTMDSIRDKLAEDAITKARNIESGTIVELATSLNISVEFAYNALDFYGLTTYTVKHERVKERLINNEHPDAERFIEEEYRLTKDKFLQLIREYNKFCSKGI